MSDAAPIKPLNLYQLTSELEALEDALLASGGEITKEMDERFDDLLDMRTDKIEGYLAMIRKFEATEEAIKSERQRLQKAERAMKNAAGSLKDRLAESMRRRGENVHETTLGKVRLQQASRRSIVIDVDEEDLPERFRRVSVRADKGKLQEALGSDDDAEREEAERYAHLDAPSYYVRIY